MSSYTFEEFKANVVEEIKDFLPEKYADASVTIQDVTKNNDRQLSGLTIRTEDNNIAPTIYLEGFFQKYEEGADMGDILQEIADARVSHEIEQGFDAETPSGFASDTIEHVDPRFWVQGWKSTDEGSPVYYRFVTVERLAHAVDPRAIALGWEYVKCWAREADGSLTYLG